MKLYDFHCNQCDQDFEELVREVGDARCTACNATDVVRKLSTFSVGGSRGDAGGGGGYSGPACSGGMCGLD